MHGYLLQFSCNLYQDGQGESVSSAISCIRGQILQQD